MVWLSAPSAVAGAGGRGRERRCAARPRRRHGVVAADGRRRPWRQRRRRSGTRSPRRRCAGRPAVPACSGPCRRSTVRAGRPVRRRLLVGSRARRSVVAVVGEAEEIAVAAEAGAQRGRDREAVHLGAQQDFGGVQRPGGEHHFAGIQSERFAGVGALHVLAVNPPPSGRSFSSHSTLVWVRMVAPAFRAIGR